MSEANMSGHVMEALRPLNAFRIENRTIPGFPDINYANGVVENKWAEKFPVRGGPLKFEHYTPDQRIFQIKRGRAGGQVHLLVNVGQAWFLFGWEFASTELYEVGITKQSAEENAEWQCSGGLNKQGLLEHLDNRKV